MITNRELTNLRAKMTMTLAGPAVKMGPTEMVFRYRSSAVLGEDVFLGNGRVWGKDTQWEGFGQDSYYERSLLINPYKMHIQSTRNCYLSLKRDLSSLVICFDFNTITWVEWLKGR
jgi:hypothetical protein